MPHVGFYGSNDSTVITEWTVESHCLVFSKQVLWYHLVALPPALLIIWPTFRGLLHLKQNNAFVPWSLWIWAFLFAVNLYGLPLPILLLLVTATNATKSSAVSPDNATTAKLCSLMMVITAFGRNVISVFVPGYAHVIDLAERFLIVTLSMLVSFSSLIIVCHLPLGGNILSRRLSSGWLGA